MRGQKSSQLVNTILTDLFMLKKPHATHFRRHNAVHPFEDPTPLEFLCQKNDASLFAFGTHSKKRPHNLVLGRTYDGKILDMFELGIRSAASMFSFASGGRGASAESKPCLLFEGPDWEHVPRLVQLRSLLTDFFRQQDVPAISPLGIDRVLVFAAPDAEYSAAAAGGDAAPPTSILLRHYAVTLRRSAEGTAPYTALAEVGPRLDLELRRVQTPADDLMKAAMTRPRATSASPKPVRNVSHSRLGGREGRLHVEKQDLRKMPTARMKGLRKGVATADDTGEKRKRSE
jgi:ribosome production factor 2